MPVSQFGYIDDKSPIQARGPDRTVVAILGGSVACYFAVNGTERLEAELADSPVLRRPALRFREPGSRRLQATPAGHDPGLLAVLSARNSIWSSTSTDSTRWPYTSWRTPVITFSRAFPRSWQARVGTNDPFMGLTRGRLLVIEEQRTDLARWHSRSLAVLGARESPLEHPRSPARLASLPGPERLLMAQVRRGPYAITGPRRDFADRQELYEHLAAIWANSSTLLNRLCSERGMRYFHFLQPNQYLPGSKPMGEEEKRMALWMEHPYRQAVELGYPLLIRNGRALKEQGIPFFDLTGIFRGHSEATYADTCCHLNQEGLDLMAQAIGHAILDGHMTAGR